MISYFSEVSRLLVISLSLGLSLSAHALAVEIPHMDGFATHEDNPTTPLQRGIKVQVLDQETHEPIVGAILKHNGKGYLTNTDGACVLAKGRGDKVTLSLRAVGFKEIVSRPYTVKPGQPLIIYLTPNVETLRTVNVEAQRRYTTQLQQSAAIDTKTLEKSPALSLAQLLEKLPGVSSISSGSTIAKPVIQGMHSSRILMINNGVRMESQSWGG